MSHAAAAICHLNVGPKDVFFQFTTLGWMMWNFAIQTLLLGTTMICYDGNPLKPVSTLWDLVEEHQVTGLGVSPRYLQTVLSAGYKPKEKHNTQSLKMMLTTGAPVSAELFHFMDRDIRKGVYMYVICLMRQHRLSLFQSQFFRRNRSLRLHCIRLLNGTNLYSRISGRCCWCSC